MDNYGTRKGCSAMRPTLRSNRASAADSTFVEGQSAKVMQVPFSSGTTTSSRGRARCSSASFLCCSGGSPPFGSSVRSGLPVGRSACSADSRFSSWARSPWNSRRCTGAEPRRGAGVRRTRPTALRSARRLASAAGTGRAFDCGRVAAGVLIAPQVIGPHWGRPVPTNPFSKTLSTPAPSSSYSKLATSGTTSNCPTAGSAGFPPTAPPSSDSSVPSHIIVDNPTPS